MEDNMTNEQFRMFVKMIIQILKDNDVDPAVIKKIEDLINE